jgi:hypothetical protein
MIQKTITCPKCKTKIELSEALMQELEDSIKQQYEKESEKVRTEADKKMKEREAELLANFSNEKKKIEEESKRKAAESLNLQISDLNEQLKEKEDSLKEAQKQELELRKRQRVLEEREKQMELEMERKMDKERNELIEKISDQFEEKHRLKDAEKDKQLADMTRQIEDLRRKAEQGSQKLRGEILELDFETRLKNEFQFDEIEAIASGVKGADVLQTVKTQSGQVCGKILWEAKRTQNWSDRWIDKLKTDQRNAKAEIAVIVSEVLPKDISQFRQIKGIWVSDISSAINLALALRVILIQTERERQIQSGRKDKKELVYEYLTGTEFRNRVEAIIEAFRAMKNDLDSERVAMEKIWSKREKQIGRVLLNIGGMHGDLEGIAGKSLPAVKALELPAK